MIDPDVLAIVNDPGMTPDAVRVTLYYAGLGAGEHPYDFDRLSMLLEEAGEKRIRKALQRAERQKWLRRHRGGRGTDRFEFSPAPKAGESTPVSPAQEAGENLSPPQAAGHNPVSPPQAAGEKPVVVEGGGVDTPFNSPEPIDLRAIRAIEQAGDKLAGCRGALIDYLSARVDRSRQYAYVQAVVSWIDNPLSTFRMPDGMPVPVDERTKLLAVALNEMAATDEATRKHKAGDTANLRTKLGVVIRARYQDTPKATGTDGRPYQRRGKQPMDQQEYTPTNEFPGWQG